jgi:hypothetical protein
MKAAIETLRGEQSDLCDAAATEEAVAADPHADLPREVRDRFAQSAALRRQHAADLDRAIALLEAAPVVLELVRAIARVRRLSREADGAGVPNWSSESRWARETIDRLLADPLVQKLIAEGE